MVRTTQTRIASRSVLGKRRRAPSGRAFKRRRFNPSRRRAVTQTTQSGFGRALQFRARRLSRRAWRNSLWRETRHLTHWRSNAGSTFVMTTQALASQATITIVDALHTTAGPFWTAAGGTLPVDSTAAPPTFRNDVVLRGGKIGLTFQNSSAGNSVAVEAFLIETSNRANFAGLPAAVAVGWDPSLVSEFSSSIGRIVYRTKFLLEPLACSTIERRLRTRKIDQEAWNTNGIRPKWIIVARDFSNVTQVGVDVISDFNVSFSGDAA